MNYIKQLQADRVEALDSARSIETEINDLISYLCCDKFRVHTRVHFKPTFLRSNLTHIFISWTKPRD
jgi:hypothetical protein